VTKLKFTIKELDERISVIQTNYLDVYLNIPIFDNVLTDTGSAPIANELIKDIKPSKAIISHSHSDHAGGGSIFSKYGVNVYTHKITASTLISLQASIHNFFPQRYRIWFEDSYVKDTVEGLKRDYNNRILVSSNLNELRKLGLEFIEAFGHTAGDIIIRLDDVFYTNDAVQGEGIIGTDKTKMVPQISDFHKYFKMIDYLKDAKIEALIPAHNFLPFSTKRILYGNEVERFLDSSEKAAKELVEKGGTLLYDGPISLGEISRGLLKFKGIENLSLQTLITVEGILRYFSDVKEMVEGEIKYYYRI
jgi:glyoxylase-like metal-dependent hydrolase (beta-lactamase superfamily II)